MKIEIELMEYDAWCWIISNEITNKDAEEIKKTDPTFVQDTHEEFYKRLEEAKGHFFWFGTMTLDGFQKKLKGPWYLPEDRTLEQTRMLSCINGLLIGRISEPEAKFKTEIIDEFFVTTREI